MDRKSIIASYNEGHSIKWIINNEYLIQHEKPKLTKKHMSNLVYETVYEHLKRKQDEI